MSVLLINSPPHHLSPLLCTAPGYLATSIVYARQMLSRATSTNVHPLCNTDRVKRSASSLADTAKSNPFHRFLQHRRRKGKKNNVSQSRETIVTPHSDHETNPTMTSPPENESSQAPTVHRTNTISIEEGRGTSSDDESYHPFTEKEEREHKTISGQIRAALFNSWINVLLIFAPAGIATHFAGVNP